MPPISSAMPTLAAMLVASLAGWLVEGPLRAVLGPAASIAGSLALSMVAFYAARQYLVRLRDGA